MSGAATSAEELIDAELTRVRPRTGPPEQRDVAYEALVADVRVLASA